MKVIYIDSTTFKCYTSQNVEGTLIPCETDFFDNKCQTFIEGYCFIPRGKSYFWEDDIILYGELIAPWKPYEELAEV